MVRRFNFYAGPCAGKSTITSFLHFVLKVMHHDAELIQEYIKEWAYSKRMPFSFDQWYIFGKQSHKEDVVLRSHPGQKPGAEYIVSDSPILLGVCYAKKCNTPGWELHKELSDVFDAEFPCANFFINRPKIYKQEGRYQDEAGAREMDDLIRNTLEEFHKPYQEIDCDNYAGLLRAISGHMGGKGLPEPKFGKIIKLFEEFQKIIQEPSLE